MYIIKCSFFIQIQAMCYKDGGCRIYEATDVMELSNWSEQVCYPLFTVSNTLFCQYFFFIVYFFRILFVAL